MKHLSKLIAVALFTLFIPFSGCDDKKKELTEGEKEALQKALQDGFSIINGEIEKLAQDTSVVKDTTAFVDAGIKIWKIWDQSEPLRDKKKLCKCAMDIYRDLGQLIGNCNNGTATLFVQTVAKCVYGGTIPDVAAQLQMRQAFAIWQKNWVSRAEKH